MGIQCENGHIACSKCCSKLADRCPSCCLPVGFRNRAIEKILESSKVLCQNAKYGCREIMIFNDRHNHETKCGYAPCSCPLSGCEFIDSSSQLYQHFSDKHKQSAVQFLYNSFFQIKLNVQDKYLILQEKKEGTLFVLNNSKNADHSANIISIDCIAPKGIDLLMDYDIIARHLSGLFSLKFQSLIFGSQQRDETPPLLGYLLLPTFFICSHEMLELDICIYRPGTLRESAQNI